LQFGCCGAIMLEENPDYPENLAPE
jgi:hypothetical protein